MGSSKGEVAVGVSDGLLLNAPAGEAARLRKGLLDERFSVRPADRLGWEPGWVENVGRDDMVRKNPWYSSEVVWLVRRKSGGLELMTIDGRSMGRWRCASALFSRGLFRQPWVICPL